MSTLDEAGFTYNPFSTDNIWGARTPLNIPGVPGDLPGVLYDSSSLPIPAGISQDIHQGSGVAPPKVQTRLQFIQQQESYKTVVFVAVLAAAFLWQRS
jgi:hypothetical protein